MTLFDEFFAKYYGDRWPTLHVALQQPVHSIAYSYPGHSAQYFLDEASVVAAQTLPFDADAKVLDLCAAPGGKTLVLAAKLGDKGSLVANERSAARRDRLRRVIKEHLPDRVQAQIQVTSHDASRWCLHEKDCYDAILLDAPCSSERHLVHQPQLLKDWSEKRSRFLAQRQYTMLASAILVVKPGGYLLYSTCSISPYENDGVIEKLLKKKGDLISVQKISPAIGEATQFGWIILPDTTGAGPLYFCLLQRN